MSASYRLFGAETSAFSIKLRSYMRYKGLEHEWLVRTSENEETLKEVARFATLPVLVTANGFAVHDTTPTIEALEADSPNPEAIPEDLSCAFLAAVLEDYADLWLSKAVMQYRWGRKKDQKEAAIRAFDEYFVSEKPENRKEMLQDSIERMMDMFPSMGLNKEMGGVVEKSFKRFVKLLNVHLEKHLFIFGGRPSIADFGLAAQLGQLLKDPTPAKIIEKEGPFVKAWCEFMDDPKPNGPFEPLADLTETLAPLFSKELAITFLPWAAANLEASLSRQEEVTVVLGKEAVTHAPLRSAARSFKDVRRKFSTRDDEEALMSFVEAVGVGEFLRRPERPKRDDDGKGRNHRRGRRRGARNKRENDTTESEAVVAAGIVAVENEADISAKSVTEAETSPDNSNQQETPIVSSEEAKVQEAADQVEKAEPADSDMTEKTEANENTSVEASPSIDAGLAEKSSSAVSQEDGVASDDNENQATKD
ncbi:glutathione S-transferase family protein [Hirschia baltica]|uniref:GST N-terminal domain-containing protein n=1 Tax=Hirschia baltica (strain ATCC 49814 / DSM 5838 / IFAM 1418) TaxID=582402 RepID=C6XRQ4_HIRBI|nr:glutathione S-transferase family protein [Hirschia baltica]ACT60664.1 hypothetical protein Hbal_2996 [Hirschia baltica ATCC 49814]